MDFLLEEITHLPTILDLGPLSINKAVVVLIVSSIVILAFMLAGARRTALVPKGVGNLAEAYVEFIRDNIIVPFMGKDGMAWVPFISTLFLFVLVNNILGLFPWSYATTSRLAVTLTLAAIVFLSVQGVGIVKHGFFGHFKALVPSGIPAVLAGPMFILEFISSLAKPLSLALRLFANMFAGHLVLGSFLGMAILFKSFMVAPMSLLGGVIMGLMEVGFSIIQAYIFAMLSAMYLGSSIKPDH